MTGKRETFVAGLILSVTFCLPAGADPKPRPGKWAAPIESPGLPNLHKVSAVLYRGAQPSATGMKNLEKMGVKTVVNLRTLHSDRGLLEGTSLKYFEVPMGAWSVEAKDMVRFLKVAVDPANQPVFVHCQHGADRTGTAVATYRIVVEGWSREEAIAEMTGGGFGFHDVWENLLKFLRGMDVEGMRAVIRP